jgi:HEAT repeat protein
MIASPLRHPDAEVRRQCLAILAPKQIDSMLTDLLSLLDDPDWRVRREVALALGRAHNVSAAVAPLLVAVEQGDVARRNAAMEAIRQIGSSVSPVILQRIFVVDASACRFLVELLGDVGTLDAVGPLEQLLFGDDANIAHAAAESLARIEATGAEAALVRALQSQEAVVRLAVLQAFASRKRPLDWTQLEPLLRDPLCRRAALLAAAWSEHPDAVQACVAVLEAGGPVASAAALSLSNRAGRSDGPTRAALRESRRAREVLEGLAQHASGSDAKRAALHCLGLIANPASVEVILKALEAPETAGPAETALNLLDSDALPSALAFASSCANSSIGCMLRWAWTLHQPAHNQQLAAIAERWIDDGGRGAVAWNIIASMGDSAAIGRAVERICSRAGVIEAAEISAALLVMLERCPEVESVLAAHAAATPFGLIVLNALARAGRSVDVAILQEALTLSDASLRAAALTAIAAISSVGDDVLRLALGDEDPVVQMAAATGLASRGTGRDVLVASLNAAEPRVRQVAVRAVASWPQGKSLALSLLHDPEASVVLAALDALGSSTGVESLVTLLGHSDGDVVSEALARLRLLDQPRAISVAETLLDHPAWTVRLEAVRALIHGGSEMRARLAVARTHENDELVAEAIDQLLAEQASR